MFFTFGSVCSGIEAASVAWHPLGWRAAWLAEIEPFPSAVLAHHYPDVPNLGDMTHLPEQIVMGEVAAPDLFCGGTPCQAFSVAGLRQSLDDARGNLSLTFCEIANAIDISRAHDGLQPCIVFWENVPGVLSTRDNAFGCFLAGLAGEGEPLVPAGGKWPNAGAVLGPQRAVAWRVLDAQYFGVAQRRRRVFVVASARDGFDPTAVLFEFDGLRRDTAPSREAGQGIADAAAAGTFECGGIGSYNRSSVSSPILRTGADKGHGCEAIIITTTHTLRGEGFDASADGTGRGTPLVPVHAADVSPCLRAGNHFNNSDTGMEAQMLVAFHPTQDPISSTDGTTHCMGTGSSQGNATIAVAFQPGNLKRGCGSAPSTEVFPTLAANHGRGQSDQDPHVAVAVSLRGREGGATAELGDEVQNCLRASSGGGGDKPHVLAAMQVRRLTPVECERLQGFPDGYTQIPWRNKPAGECPDGPRYKALGNSWAVPVVRWIGWRIAAQVYGGLA